METLYIKARYAPLPLSLLFLPSLQAADRGACAISMTRRLTYPCSGGPAGPHVVKRHKEERRHNNTFTANDTHVFVCLSVC